MLSFAYCYFTVFASVICACLQHFSTIPCRNLLAQLAVAALSISHENSVSQTT